MPNKQGPSGLCIFFSHIAFCFIIVVLHTHTFDSLLLIRQSQICLRCMRLCLYRESNADLSQADKSYQGEQMPELIVLVILVMAAVKYSKSLRNSAKAAEYKSYAWSEKMKVEAIEDIATIEIDDATVAKANTVIERVNSFKLNS